MNLEETGLLLGRIANIDNRHVDGNTIAGWFEYVNTISLANALEALRDHRMANPGVYVEPGHIVKGAKIVRARITARMRTPEHPSTIDPGDVPLMIAWQREYVRLVADGLPEDSAADAACHALNVPIPPPPAELESKPVAALVATIAKSTRPSRRVSSSQEEK